MNLINVFVDFTGNIQSYKFAKKISDYPFLIQKLPQKSNLPQFKKHCIIVTTLQKVSKI